VRRSSSERLPAAVAGRLRELGLATSAEGFNLDFHTIRHHGQSAKAAVRVSGRCRRVDEHRALLVLRVDLDRYG
jgi:hypothetical protein